VKIFAGEIGFEEGFIIEKPIFLRKLAHLATVKGADIWVNSEVIDVLVENQKVSGVKVKKNGEEVNLKAKIIIGCDGINSLCARRLFNREGYKLIPCIQYRMANCKLEDEHVLEVFVGQNIAPYGYAWIFPKGNGTANVGIGVRKGQAKVYLDKFISNHPEKFKNAKIIELGAGAVPVGGQIPNIVNKNVVLCGDAAGQVIPLTGGGIHSSIAAGKTAGEIAGEVAKSKNEKIDLSGYPQKYNEYWGKRIASSLKALKVMEKLSDDELNKLAEILSGKDIVDLADGFDVKRVGKELLKHPLFALKIAKALLSG
jgi:digeranylgeranylglycerophospholipid reductase